MTRAHQQQSYKCICRCEHEFRWIRDHGRIQYWK